MDRKGSEMSLYYIVLIILAIAFLYFVGYGLYKGLTSGQGFLGSSLLVSLIHMITGG